MLKKLMILKASPLNSGAQFPECVTELNVVENQSVMYCGTTSTIITHSFTYTGIETQQTSKNLLAAASTQMMVASGTDG
jgi:hypothetical protein